MRSDHTIQLFGEGYLVLAELGGCIYIYQWR